MGPFDLFCLFMGPARPNCRRLKVTNTTSHTYLEEAIRVNKQSVTKTQQNGHHNFGREKFDSNHPRRDSISAFTVHRIERARRERTVFHARALIAEPRMGEAIILYFNVKRVPNIPFGRGEEKEYFGSLISSQTI
jgi:hypothetical protein